MSILNDNIENIIKNFSNYEEYNEYDYYGFETTIPASSQYTMGFYKTAPEGAPDDFTSESEPDEIIHIDIDLPKDAVTSPSSNLEIKRKLTKYNHNVLPNKKNLYLVIHYVGCESSAAANANYFYTGQRGASAHYFVDEKEIWQIVEDNDVAWHVGAYSYKHPYCRNSNSIGIELCVKRDSKGNWYYEDNTVKQGIELARIIVNKYNIPKNHVLRHYDVTGKICGEPHVRDEKSWIEFRDSIYRMERNRTYEMEDDEMVEKVNYDINGKKFEIDSIVKDGTTYMAIAGLRNAGFTVEYENETKLRTIKNDINKIKVADGDNSLKDVNAININGNNFGKLRDLALVLGYSINYNTETGEIRFYK